MFPTVCSHRRHINPLPTLAFNQIKTHILKAKNHRYLNIIIMVQKSQVFKQFISDQDGLKVTARLKICDVVKPNLHYISTLCLCLNHVTENELHDRLLNCELSTNHSRTIHNFSYVC